MSIALATIASGSSGNCNIITSGNTVIMSDCGISGKKALAGLSSLCLHAPDAILISHSHTDHIKGAYTVAKKFDIPVYITNETLDECVSLPKEITVEISPEKAFSISDLTIKPFSVSHDTKLPLAYTFQTKTEKAAVITDTGIITEQMLAELRGSKSIIIESNHDEKMLMDGPRFAALC